MSSRTVGAVVGVGLAACDHILEALLPVRVVARDDDVFEVGRLADQLLANRGYSASDTTSTRARLSASMKR